jgi:predicted secreted Zn-dependent protease
MMRGHVKSLRVQPNAAGDDFRCASDARKARYLKRQYMMKQALLTAATFTCMAMPAGAASVSKTYSYFPVGGSTLEQIEAELSRRGPQVSHTNGRHPGATQMQFTTKITYTQGKGSCRVAEAKTTLTAKVILPKWRRPAKAAKDVRLVWDTLASDIKRHEESHLVIAKNYARELEQALMGMSPQKNCEIAAEKAKTITEKVLTRHKEAQAEFDRIEGKNFESRLTRLLKYRLQQIHAGRIPG